MQISTFKDMYVAELQELRSLEEQLADAGGAQRLRRERAVERFPGAERDAHAPRRFGARLKLLDRPGHHVLTIVFPDLTERGVRA